MNLDVYKCGKCGKVVTTLSNGGGTLVCCGEDMLNLVPNTVDAATEKHVPAYKLNGTTLDVQIGEVAHPMTPEHSIQWVAVLQCCKVQYVKLVPTDEPHATFTLDSTTEPFAIYEYCNLHGLWTV